MDQMVKVDYSGSVNVMTMTFTGLPAEQTRDGSMLYGAGNGGRPRQHLVFGSGLTAVGTATIIVYNGSATGRDVTLSSAAKGSQLGKPWPAPRTAPARSPSPRPGRNWQSVWWQTYMNGLQLQSRRHGAQPSSAWPIKQWKTVSTVNLEPGRHRKSAPRPINGTKTARCCLSGQTSPTLTLHQRLYQPERLHVYSLVAENADRRRFQQHDPDGQRLGLLHHVGNVSVSPSNGATGICYDTPLTVTFSDTVSLGSRRRDKDLATAANPGSAG
jgi:hypothetical protein